MGRGITLAGEASKRDLFNLLVGGYSVLFLFMLILGETPFLESSLDY